MEKVKDSRFELIDSSKLDGDLVVRPINIGISLSFAA